MKNHVKINNKEYSIPSSFSELSILKFQRLNASTEPNEFDKHANIISIVLDLDILDVYQMTFTEVRDVNTHLAFLFGEYEMQQNFKSSITIRGVELFLQTNLQKLSLGELIDLQTLISENAIDNLHRIMAILYREKEQASQFKHLINALQLKDVELKKYDHNISSEIAEILQEEMSIEDANAALVFFCNILNDYMSCSDGYLAKMIMKMKILMKKKRLLRLNKTNFLKNGVGLASLNDLHKVMSPNLTK